MRMTSEEQIEDVASVEDARDLLRCWREDVVRRPEDVLTLYEELLTSDALETLGQEKWMVLEQVVVAALDCHRHDLVHVCLSELRAHFSDESIRVRQLVAMQAEMNEEYEQALHIYDDILIKDETNSAVRKRKIAVLKARGELAAAVAELCKYLKDFMSDTEAWMELCDIYVEHQEHAKAAFCCEELILHNPHNHLYFQRYAEIRYTQGGFENLELARTYYSQALKLNPDNTRALYGLLLASSQLASSPKGTSSKKRDYLKSIEWTEKKLQAKYEKAGGKSSSALVETVVNQLKPPGISL